jgi:hypothetical protein
MDYRIVTAQIPAAAVLDFAQAQHKVREWWRCELQRAEGHDIRQGRFTAADGVCDGRQKAVYAIGAKPDVAPIAIGAFDPHPT